MRKNTKPLNLYFFNFNKKIARNKKILLKKRFQNYNLGREIIFHPFCERAVRDNVVSIRQRCTKKDMGVLTPETGSSLKKLKNDRFPQAHNGKQIHRFSFE